MTQVAQARGIRLTSRSRPLVPEDLANFDIILGMDESNVNAIRQAGKHWQLAGLVSTHTEWERKVSLMTDYFQDAKWRRYKSVPDPYYGGPEGFELVLDLLEDACFGLLKELQAE